MRTDNIEDIYELSPVQQGMLFHTLLSPESGFYFVQVVYDLHGRLDVEAFGKALQRLIDRHTILRTSFIWDELDKPLQIVHRQVNLPLRQLDWREVSAGERERLLEEFLLEDRRAGFALHEAPLMRVTLVRVAEETFKFILSNHHILLDGWSVSILLKEFSTLYQAFRQGVEVYLERGRPYGDYIAWLQQHDPTAAESFWRAHLAGVAAPTPLRTSPVAGGLQCDEGEEYGELFFNLPAETAEALRSLARQKQLTLNTILQGAWALVLGRYSSQDDVVLGVTSSGRPPTLEGVEGMIGLFINTLPLRVRVSPEMPLVLWLKELLARQVEVREYEHTPLVQIQGWSEVPRSMPLFESILEFENYPVDPLLKKPVGTRSTEVQDSRIGGFGRTNYSMTVCLAEDEGGLTATVGYRKQTLDARAAGRMLDYFKHVLEAIAADPECRVADLQTLTKTERLQMAAWNDTARPYPRTQTLHELIERQAERTPEQVAVAASDGELTYAELMRRAEALARRLRRLGVGPERVVGVLVGRGCGMVVTLLGVLKAGGAYLPLEASYPEERLRLMTGDCGVEVIVAERGLAGLAERLAALVVPMDENKGEEQGEESRTEVSGENLAYVIYTSGSTGRPKGVMIRHSSVVSLMYWAKDVYTPEDMAGVLSTTSILFDCSVFELYAPLCWGGKIIIGSNVLSLPTLPAAGEVTLVSIIPSTLYELLRMGGLPDSVRAVNFGGEFSHDELIRALEKRPSMQRLVHLYGPAEDTTYSTFSLIAKSDRGKLSIGRPLSNSYVYILNQHGRQVPVNVPGELYIGGDGLARGYQNRPGLTAERFVPDPFSGRAGGCLYRTGDLGFYLPDGNIQLLGRLDHQVKIRGCRVELGEIENVLKSRLSLREAVVLLREDRPGEKRLVAYVTRDGDKGDFQDDPRSTLQRYLPDYMIPTTFVPLEAMPLLPNGKVDRNALPPPADNAGHMGGVYSPPRDDLEFRLVKIWEDLFEVSPISVRDNFFDLGGHSLLALGLVSRIQRAFDQSFPLSLLFEAQTIEQLAEALRKEGWTVPRSPLVAIQSGGTRPPLFCVHDLGGHVLFYRDLSRHLGAEQPFYAFQAPPLDEAQNGGVTAEELASMYVREMRSFQPRSPYFLAGASLGGVIAFEMAQQLRAQGDEVALLVMFDTNGPGYPNYPPGTSVWSQRAHEFKMVLEDHAEIFFSLEPEKRWRYFFQTVRKAGASTKARFVKRYETLTRKPSRGSGDTLPASLRKTQDAILRACTEYVPQVYAGRLLLFRCSKQPRGIDPDPTLGWGKLVAGGIDICEVRGLHANVFLEPRVRNLAAKLKGYIGKAQQTVGAPLESHSLSPTLVLKQTGHM